jgi:5-methylthioadenosine/S-adenosylhomocysteine deaminase
VFDMATIEGARALKMGNELGSIEPGKIADLAVIDLKHPAMTPTCPQNLVSNLVYSCQSDCVRDTIVEGKLVMRRGKIITMDSNKVIEHAQKSSEKFFK